MMKSPTTILFLAFLGIFLLSKDAYAKDPRIEGYRHDLRSENTERIEWAMQKLRDLEGAEEVILEIEQIARKSRRPHLVDGAIRLLGHIGKTKPRVALRSLFRIARGNDRYKTKWREISKAMFVEIGEEKTIAFLSEQMDSSKESVRYVATTLLKYVSSSRIEKILPLLDRGLMSRDWEAVYLALVTAFTISAEKGAEGLRPLLPQILRILEAPAYRTGPTERFQPRQCPLHLACVVAIAIDPKCPRLLEALRKILLHLRSVQASETEIASFKMLEERILSGAMPMVSPEVEARQQIEAIIKERQAAGKANLSLRDDLDIELIVQKLPRLDTFERRSFLARLMALAQENFKTTLRYYLHIYGSPDVLADLQLHGSCEGFLRMESILDELDDLTSPE